MRMQEEAEGLGGITLDCKGWIWGFLEETLVYLVLFKLFLLLFYCAVDLEDVSSAIDFPEMWA
eukprot:1141333-Pelagomonas_calceolata.AAC.1